MKVVIDARMVGPVGHGIARYVELMAKGLSGIQRDYQIVFLTRPGIRIQGFECVTVTTPFLSPAELVQIPRVLKKLGADLYHSPSFSSLVTAPCPWVVTVHDLIHLHYGTRAQKLYYELLLKRFIKNAVAVTTVSEYSRDLIHRWADTDSEVVYNAIEESQGVSLRDTALPGALQAGNYFLCLSNEKTHKNLGTLLRAYEEYRKTSNAPWPIAITAPLKKSSPGVVQLGALDSNDAERLIKSAGALFYPSLMEGFGRPPLEAAVDGVPVVVSRISPHQEAMIDFKPNEVEWVLPWDEAGWSSAFLKAQRREVKPASQETRSAVLRRYSVSSMGDHMDRLYRRVLGMKA
jgi:glycosyltransferase involved in cell wall biosynthesis